VQVALLDQLVRKAKQVHKVEAPQAQVVPQGLKVLLDLQVLVVLDHKDRKDHRD
jgi:hypothetical protein